MYKYINLSIFYRIKLSYLKPGLYVRKYFFRVRGNKNYTEKNVDKNVNSKI